MNILRPSETVWTWPQGQSETRMGLTLRQAADLCGASRSTIHRALKSGKLSGGRLKDGAWDIDPSELARVFPWDTTGPDQRDDAGQARNSANEREAVLSVKVEMLEQQLERERDTVTDLRKRLDRAEDRVLALTAPLQVPTPSEKPMPGTLWGRLRDALKGRE